MWTSLRTEIEKIRHDLNLKDSEFGPLDLNEWQEVEEKIRETFCKIKHHKIKSIWLWEYFKLDTYSFIIEKNAYIYLDKLISNNETVWFFVNESVKNSTKFWFYQGQVKYIQLIISETGIDEVYLVSKRYDWLICINHHDAIFATGKTMPDRLREFVKTIPSPYHEKKDI